MIEIRLYGPLGFESFDGHHTTGEQVRTALAGSTEEVSLLIDSRGGDIFEGQGILTALRDHPAAIHARVVGVAFSMAAVIALQADSLSMHPDGWLMFHEAQNNSGGGTATELRTRAGVLERFNADQVGRLAEAFGLPAEEIARRLADDIWLSGSEAFAGGLVDTLLEPAKAVACVSFEDFPTAPLALLSRRGLDSTQDPDKKESRTKNASHESTSFFLWLR